MEGAEVSMDGLRTFVAGSRGLEELEGVASGDAVWVVSWVDMMCALKARVRREKELIEGKRRLLRRGAYREVSNRQSKRSCESIVIFEKVVRAVYAHHRIHQDCGFGKTSSVCG